MGEARGTHASGLKARPATARAGAEPREAEARVLRPHFVSALKGRHSARGRKASRPFRAGGLRWLGYPGLHPGYPRTGALIAIHAASLRKFPKGIRLGRGEVSKAHAIPPGLNVASGPSH